MLLLTRTAVQPHVKLPVRLKRPCNWLHEQHVTGEQVFLRYSGGKVDSRVNFSSPWG